MASFPGVFESGFSAVVFHQSRQKANWRNRAAWLVFLAVVAYGGLDELTQPYFGKNIGFDGFLADAGGDIGRTGDFYFSDILAVIAGGMGNNNFRSDNAYKGRLVKNSADFRYCFSHLCLWRFHFNLGPTHQSLSVAQDNDQPIVDDNKLASWPDVFREGLVDSSWQVFYGDGDAVFGRRNFSRCDSNMLI